ncbi:MAG: V-type ATP synthase subunit E family protein [Lachnospiraceae bacterium]|nr:V-type ATP synthase subunit E family protein [Lachnospiraceae bacterium]MDY5741421.1 V-type ATP synthase subunit E family protein [Lachnospiraceae bacterium]
MKGLEYILAQIKGQAEAKAAEITAEYDEKIAAWEADFQAKAAAELAAAEQQSRNKERLAREKTVSQAEMAKKNALLTGKRKLLGDSLNQVREYLAKQPVEAYAAMVSDLVLRKAGKQNGQLVMTAEDMGVLDAAWLQDLNIRLQAAGKGTLTINSQQQLPDGEAGVLVIYEETEENCTLSGLFSEHREALEDAVAVRLFS